MRTGKDRWERGDRKTKNRWERGDRKAKNRWERGDRLRLGRWESRAAKTTTEETDGRARKDRWERGDRKTKNRWERGDRLRLGRWETRKETKRAMDDGRFKGERSQGRVHSKSSFFNPDCFAIEPKVPYGISSFGYGTITILGPFLNFLWLPF